MHGQWQGVLFGPLPDPHIPEICVRNLQDIESSESMGKAPSTADQSRPEADTVCTIHDRSDQNILSRTGQNGGEK